MEVVKKKTHKRAYFLGFFRYPGSEGPKIGGAGGSALFGSAPDGVGTLSLTWRDFVSLEHTLFFRTQPRKKHLLFSQ